MGTARPAIYRKYCDEYFKDFLRNEAKHDIDGDGKMWCSKKEWVEFLCPKISEDDGNAIGHIHCRSDAKSAKTASDMAKLIEEGKRYICHRVYNQIMTGLKKRREGRDVVYFRLLENGEEATPPALDAITLLKKIFIEKGERNKRRSGISYKLTADQAYDYLISKLDKNKFPDEESQQDEWQRAINTLTSQGVEFKGGYYLFKPKK